MTEKGAAAAVEALFAAHANGSTACKLPAPQPDFGNAAAAPDGDTTTPLVIANHGGEAYLQTRWFFEAEKKIAAHFLKLHSTATNKIAPERLETYFPEPGRQRDATELALGKNLAIITGGPGTGKTHTLARIISLLLEGGNEAKDIQLAAPTGKAADCMRDAVVRASEGLDESLRADLGKVASTSRTIHGLLEYNPGHNSCRYHATNPLPCGILVLDECSMIDTLLWQALVEALPSDYRLILLGDPNQLESVGTGCVLAEISKAPALSGSRIHLEKSHRFRDRPAISELSLLIEKEDATGTADLLAKNTADACASGLFWNESTNIDDVLKNLPASVWEAIQSVATADTPKAALDALDRIRILTAHRTPDTGYRSIDTAIEKRLAKDKIPIRNRPVIINRNDPETGLRNGQVGIVHSTGSGRRVLFPNGKTCSFAELPGHSPAWSITIHRSQGSEYENVVVVLPKKSDSPLATRKLLYTAITRAKRSLFVFGPADVIKKAVSEPVGRTSLLSLHLETPRH
jgi:exodeoxyribonuclease V alpha subunit